MEDPEDPRQYYCPKCETLTVINEGIRGCRCYKTTHITTKNWQEVFYDRVNE